MRTRSSRSCLFDSLVCGFVLPVGAGAQWQYTRPLGGGVPYTHALGIFGSDSGCFGILGPP